MCRGAKVHCWMLLPEPPSRCVWYGGEGKVPLELCQEPLEQEVALPWVAGSLAEIQSMFPEMLQQEKEECGSMQSETGVSAPAANTSPRRNWAENRQKKKKPKPKEKIKQLLILVCTGCCSQVCGAPLGSELCVPQGRVPAVLWDVTKPPGDEELAVPHKWVLWVPFKPCCSGLFSPFLYFFFPGAGSALCFWGGQPPSDLHACYVTQDYFYLMNNSAPRCWFLFWNPNIQSLIIKPALPNRARDNILEVNELLGKSDLNNTLCQQLLLLLPFA